MRTLISFAIITALLALSVCAGKPEKVPSCFVPIPPPSATQLAGMWSSAGGFTLAGGNTFKDYGEMRLYHDAYMQNLYVYIRNDGYYTGESGHIKFDVSATLADLGRSSNLLNREQHDVPVASTPPGTEIWFKTDMTCWFDQAQIDDCVTYNQIFVSCHINAILPGAS